MSFVQALKWSFLSEFAAKIIQPLVFVMLARLLMPEDFGVMTAAMMIIALSQIFWESGMVKALIQRQTHIEEAANATFMINICLGVLAATLLYFFAKPISETFFQDGRIVAVIRVMTLQILMGSLSSVQTALIQKAMGFKKLFWVRFATVSLPGLASVPLAWGGWGYWALVIGTLIGQFVQVIMLWSMSEWRPKFKFDNVVTIEVSRFGAWVIGTGLLAWFYAWADSLVVGHYLGSHSLGLFNTGGKLPALVFAMIFGPILPVLYSHLSKIGADREAITYVAELVVMTLTIIAVPILVTFFIFAEHIEFIIFGEKWKGVGLVLAGMAVMHGYSWIIGMNGEFYRSLGKPAYETIVTATTLFVYLLVYLWVIDRGLEMFVIARAMLAIGALGLHLYILKKILSVNLYSILKKIILVTFISIVIVWLSKITSIALTDSLFLQFLYGIFLSGIFLVIALLVTEKKLTKQIVNLMLKRKEVA